MNVKRFPWVKSFDLMEGHSLCHTYDIERGAAIPASYSVMGRKLLLVGLDSMFKAQAVLPQVGSITVQRQAPAIPAVASPSVDVLIGLEDGDPRVAPLVNSYGAVEYKSLETCKLYIVSANNQREADNILSTTAAAPGGMFSFRHDALHQPTTLTLSCSKHVRSDELYSLLNASSVIPMAKNRYRFTTNQKMLNVARVLWKQNRYAKGDNKKYKTLRDDLDYFAILDQKELAALPF